MQAIVVKFLGPTDFKPSRWSVRAGDRHPWIVSKGQFCDQSDNRDARMAAEAYAAKLGWTGPLYGDMREGGLPDGSRVFVFIERG